MPALATARMDPVLDALKRRHLGQVEHLARLRLLDPRAPQIPPAALASLNLVQHHVVGILPPLQVVALMPLLAARLAT
jgi:hypothetical protein